MKDDLEGRVRQFRAMSLPGQPMMMHMGTSYLINDLWSKIEELKTLCSEMEAVEIIKTKKAIELIEEYGWIDGGHHKQWVLDQIIRVLVKDYDEWKRGFCDGEDGQETYEWDEGIAP